jgi:hypothetical protein
MQSKEVTDREKAVREIASAIETHATAAIEGMGASLRPFLRKGEHMPDAALLLALMGRRLASTSAVLKQADDAHEKELGDDAAPRDARDAAASVLYTTCTEIRDQIASVHGDSAITALRINGTTPSDALELETWATNFAGRLRDKAVKLPDPKRRTARIDREAMAEELESSLTPLIKAMKDVAREKREAEATQAAKNKAMADHDVAFSQTAAFCTATFRAAGMTELADKVKASRRRPGRTAASDTPVTPPADSPVKNP